MDIHAFKSQQFRWAKGSIQTARKLLDTILRSSVATPIKVEALIHLTSNACYPLMILLSLLMFPAMYLRRDADPRMLLLLDLPIFLGATGAIVLFYVISQVVIGPDGRRNIPYHPIPDGIGRRTGRQQHQSRALRSASRWRGIPKDTEVSHRESGRSLAGQAIPRLAAPGPRSSRSVLAGYMILCFTVACSLGMWFSLPFLYLFLHGYCYMTFLTLRHERATRSFKDLGAPSMRLATGTEDTAAELGT